MDDYNLIATFTASSPNGVAATAFRHPHNQSRFIGTSRPTNDDISRETTPFFAASDDTDYTDEGEHLEWRLDQHTKVAGRLSFGSDAERCDVLIVPKRGQYSISGIHCFITFGDEGQLILKDISTNGTRVEYEGRAPDRIRKHFQWILFREYRITVKLGHMGVAFRVRMPIDRQVSSMEKYQIGVRRLMSVNRKSLSPFEQLVINDTGTLQAPSEVATPTQRPIYLQGDCLGQGAYGAVYKVVNVSTGVTYAGKEFFSNRWEKEINILRQLKHEHIINFIDVSMEQRPILIMELAPFGNLESESKRVPLLAEEINNVLNQGLIALDYLHSQEIAHRDIKPENILILTRTPLHIKLADFGLAQDRAVMATLCGTRDYLAPEIHTGNYCHKVDLWSLGVVVAQYACKGRDATVFEFLHTYMLVMDPKQRLEARECLEMAQRSELLTSLSTSPSRPRHESTIGGDTIRLSSVIDCKGEFYPATTASKNRRPVKRSDIYQTVECNGTSVTIRKKDLKVNITHCSKLSQYCGVRFTVKDVKKLYPDLSLQSIKGVGTFIDLDAAMLVCREFRLFALCDKFSNLRTG